MRRSRRADLLLMWKSSASLFRFAVADFRAPLFACALCRVAETHIGVNTQLDDQMQAFRNDCVNVLFLRVPSIGGQVANHLRQVGTRRLQLFNRVIESGRIRLFFFNSGFGGVCLKAFGNNFYRVFALTARYFFTSVPGSMNFKSRPPSLRGSISSTAARTPSK